MSHGRGKSDRGVVPKRLPNKAAGEVPAGAEAVEGGGWERILFTVVGAVGTAAVSTAAHWLLSRPRP